MYITQPTLTLLLLSSPPPQYKPRLPKKQDQAGKDSSYSSSNPPGAAVVMRNTNFSQTYTLSPDHPSPSSYSPSNRKQSRVPVPVSRNPAVRNRQNRQQYNGDAYAGMNDYSNGGPMVHGYGGEGLALSPIKKTAFSKMSSGSPPKDYQNHEPSVRRPEKASISPPFASSHSHSNGRALRSSATSRRLFAALEYSDNSSEDGSGLLQQRQEQQQHSDHNGHISNGGVRGHSRRGSVGIRGVQENGRQPSDQR